MKSRLNEWLNQTNSYTESINLVQDPPIPVLKILSRSAISCLRVQFCLLQFVNLSIFLWFFNCQFWKFSSSICKCFLLQFFNLISRSAISCLRIFQNISQDIFSAGRRYPAWGFTPVAFLLRFCLPSSDRIIITSSFAYLTDNICRL